MERFPLDASAALHVARGDRLEAAGAYGASDGGVSGESFGRCKEYFADFLFVVRIFLARKKVSGILRAMTERVTLPDLDTLDFAALKALILSQHEQLASRDSEIEQLKLLIAKLRRMQFGRKSEKLDWQIEQLELKLDELEPNPGGERGFFPNTKTTEGAVPVVKPTRRPLPAHLPREERKSGRSGKPVPTAGAN